MYTYEREHMKKYIVGLMISIGVCCGIPVAAQPIPVLFQSLSWEQASMVAARENKLVLVEVGNVAAGIEKKFQRHGELMNYMMRNVVAIRMNMSTPAGKEFEPRLLLYPYPAYAYFMPYGDLVGIVTPEQVERNPEVLRETLQLAQRAALEKKNNSRSVAFADMDFQQMLVAAKEADRNIFIFVSDAQNQPSLLMEKNVFNLDQVADFYNQNFINLHVSAKRWQGMSPAFKIEELPAFLYLNANGKLLYQAQGYCTASQLVQYGNQALERARGIQFKPLADDQARLRAGQTGRLIFTDYYAVGSAHKELVKNVFSDPEVTSFFTENFVNVGREGNVSCLTFSDASGKELHRVVRVKDAAEMLQEAKRALAGKGVAGMQQAYSQGEREAGFMEDYIRVLARAGMSGEASRITVEYLSSLSPDCLKEKKYWDFFYLYAGQVIPGFFEYILSHRSELFRLHGEEKVRKKITDLWIAGAEEFVKEGSFDEVGFKAYTKRLKKEKVEGWRLIVRNARMHAAEKLEDWKTFVNLAEEKWNEEQIPDAELYRWGMKVNEQCRDANVRYKMAQWLVQRAIEIERKERLNGKVRITSYKGFFEKLADDLMKE